MFGRSPRVRRVIRIALPALIVAYAAILRFDAVTRMYGPVERPAWLRTLQVQSSPALARLRPAPLAFGLEPMHPHRDGPPSRYSSDPYTYLVFARQMSSFYAAHYREPGYPFVTKIFLWLLDDQDVAVSFGSAFCSVLAVLATYLLGAVAFSPWVGLGAALGMAIDRDVVYFAANGGRDDLFTLTVVLFAYALIRLQRDPSWRAAVLAGAVGGGACLVRITSPSFIVPGLAFVLLALKRPRPERLRLVALSLLLAAALVAPYVINCWRTFGRPLYALDGPASVYQVAEGQRGGATAAAYVGSKLVAHTFETLDTVSYGMTGYPFRNKWQGLEAWLPGGGTALSWAALAGLLLFAGRPTGRLLLLVLAASLVPYAVTWKLSSEWRLTEVAYPFFLIAAFFGVHWLTGWARPSRLRHLREIPTRRWWRIAVFWITVLAVVASARYAIQRLLPVLAVEERLALLEEVTITAGDRDAGFFRQGWSSPRASGPVTFRDARAPRAEMWLRLPAESDYGATLRLDPFPRPTGERPPDVAGIRVLLNRRLVGVFPCRWDPARVAAYDVRLPAGIVRKGWNRVEIVADGARVGGAEAARGSDGPTFSVWYLRIRPARASSPSRPS